MKIQKINVDLLCSYCIQDRKVGWSVCHMRGGTHSQHRWRKGVTFHRFSITSLEQISPVALPLSCFLEWTNTSNNWDMNEQRKPCEPRFLWHSEQTACEGSPLSAARGKVMLCYANDKSPTLEQGRKHSSENTVRSIALSYRVNGPAQEIISGSWRRFSAFSELWAKSRVLSPHSLQQHLQKLFSFRALLPVTLWKGPCRSWHVGLSVCCHLHHVSRNVIMAEQVHSLPPLESPLIILY